MIESIGCPIFFVGTTTDRNTIFVKKKKKSLAMQKYEMEAHGEIGEAIKNRGIPNYLARHLGDIR